MSVNLIHVLGWVSLALVVVLFLIVCLFNKEENDHGENRSMDYHRREGGYRVLYNDGKLSQPFLHQTAKDYAEMFGGQVVSRNFKRPNETSASQG